jgi:class 3 adenylate cyclase
MMTSVRRDLPSGTITFLFTDVEGSTRLLHELGAEGYAEALAEHRRLIRGACTRYDGVEVDTQGDAFFFAFPTAPGALSAAGAMTEALASGPIQVRVGLHTGTPLLTDEGYVGGDVHRAARIAAAGHGGQVLVSASTAQLIALELTDLGEHRLKDLSGPERIFQLGDGAFPVLKSLYRTNLPVPATAFLGRDSSTRACFGSARRSTGLATGCWNRSANTPPACSIVARSVRTSGNVTSVSVSHSSKRLNRISRELSSDGGTSGSLSKKTTCAKRSRTRAIVETASEL